MVQAKLEYYERKFERMSKRLEAQQSVCSEMEGMYDRQRELTQTISDKLYEEQMSNIKLKIENDILRSFFENLKASEDNGKILEKLVQKFQLLIL